MLIKQNSLFENRILKKFNSPKFSLQLITQLFVLCFTWHWSLAPAAYLGWIKKTNSKWRVMKIYTLWRCVLTTEECAPAHQNDVTYAIRVRALLRQNRCHQFHITARIAWLLYNWFKTIAVRKKISCSDEILFSLDAFTQDVYVV